MGGGGYSAPEITTETEPAKQAVKSVSAAASAAAEAQRERAKKSRGIAASILTGANAARDNAGGKTLGA